MFFVHKTLHGTRVAKIFLRAQPGGCYCSFFSAFLFNFGFWVFLVKPSFCKKTQLEVDGFWDFYGFSVIRMSTARYILSTSNEYKILRVSVNFITS